jgi:hypothetical protein
MSVAVCKGPRRFRRYFSRVPQRSPAGPLNCPNYLQRWLLLFARAPEGFVAICRGPPRVPAGPLSFHSYLQRCLLLFARVPTVSSLFAGVPKGSPAGPLSFPSYLQRCLFLFARVSEGFVAIYRGPPRVPSVILVGSCIALKIFLTICKGHPWVPAVSYLFATLSIAI